MDDATRHHLPDIVVDAELELLDGQAGRRPVRDAEAHLAKKTVRAVAGFVLIGAGIALLPLPGPGWVIIAAGLGLLPFRWAVRLTAAIRRRIPGVPEEGRIPARTLVVWGVVIVAGTAAAIAFGSHITTWLAETWGDPDRIFG